MYDKTRVKSPRNKQPIISFSQEGRQIYFAHFKNKTIDIEKKKFITANLEYRLAVTLVIHIYSRLCTLALCSRFTGTICLGVDNKQKAPRFAFTSRVISRRDTRYTFYVSVDR